MRDLEKKQVNNSLLNLKISPIKFLKTKATIVFLLNFLDGILQQVPDVFNILVIHSHLCKERKRKNV